MLEVVMNRDEALTRPPERPPAIMTISDGTWSLAPRDSARGGTWCGVNSHGIVACLLNGYTEDDFHRMADNSVTTTRGELVDTALSRDSVTDIQQWLSHGFDAESYLSFDLVVIGVNAAFRYRWRRGEAVTFDTLSEGWHCLSSSSWNTDAVLAWRRAQFQHWQDAGCARKFGLPEFHLLSVAGREDWSPLLDRSFSATRSITQVSLRFGAGQQPSGFLRYWQRQAGESLQAKPHSECSWTANGAPPCCIHPRESNGA